MSRIYDALKRAGHDVPIEHASSRSSLQLASQPIDRVNEAYQRIVQGLMSLLVEERCRVILVVSAVAGEGTSTVARNLARLLGEDPARKTVLVDANLRTPSQHVFFREERGNGLAEVASGTIPVDDALIAGPEPGLSRLNCGRPTKDPARLLHVAEVRDLFTRLRESSRWVIVDGPPATVFSDVVPLSSLTDGILLVTRADRTRWQVVQQARRTVEGGGGRILGGVLNGRRYYIPEALYSRT